MKRREFIKVCGLLGISLPFHTYGSSFRKLKSSSPQSVIVIGAGAAGMAAGYLLAQQGIRFKILEAASTYGGRMKRTKSFTDFPIPLGAEWLHVSKTELSQVINNKNVAITTELKGYSGLEEVGYYDDGDLSFTSLRSAFGSDFEDKKFINSTWLDFFEEYVVPSIDGNIQFNSQIASIDYKGHKTIVTDVKGAHYEADKVIVTVPLKVLQDSIIKFIPEFSKARQLAIKRAPIWGGLKVFIEFSDNFYPTYLTFPDSETSVGQRAYFDAAYGQNSLTHILGLFAVGQQAEQYQELTGQAQVEYILNELDQIFDGRASRSYKQHIVQDWNKEPFIQSAYLADVAPSAISTALYKSIDEKVYFAGDSYTQEDDWGGVHNATRSARDVVDEMTQI